MYQHEMKTVEFQDGVRFASVCHFLYSSPCLVHCAVTRLLHEVSMFEADAPCQTVMLDLGNFDSGQFDLGQWPT